MTSFVLVHGGWHGGWCWDRVTPLLTAAGHHVAAPTLTGLGDRAAEAHADISIEMHAADIEQAVRAQGGPVVLVSHSYSGAPIEVAAPRLADRLARIVHIDSFALDDGEAILDTFPPPVRDAVLAQAAATGSGWRVEPLPPPLLGLSDPDDIAFVVPRLTVQPLRTMQEPVRIGPGAEDVPRTYVECMIGADSKPFGLFADRARAQGWDSRVIDASHEVMITDPPLVANLLLETAVARTAAA
jgi:pimeloyl-ACP methyl ester carboxylesterase